MAAVGQVVIESGLVADNDTLTLTGTQQAKVLFISCNPDNTNIKFRYQNSSGDMPLTQTRASAVKGASGIEMSWIPGSNATANTNVNSPIYIDANHEISLGTASTVNFTIIIYQFTEV